MRTPGFYTTVASILLFSFVPRSVLAQLQGGATQNVALPFAQVADGKCPDGTVHQGGGVSYKHAWSLISATVKKAEQTGDFEATCSWELACEQRVESAAGGGVSVTDPLLSVKPSMSCKAILTEPERKQLTTSFSALITLLKEESAEEGCKRAAPSACGGLGVDPTEFPEVTSDPEGACCVDPQLCREGASPYQVATLPLCKVELSYAPSNKHLLNVFGPYEDVKPRPSSPGVEKTMSAKFYCSLCDRCSSNLTVKPNIFARLDDAQTCTVYDMHRAKDECAGLESSLKDLFPDEYTCETVRTWTWSENQDGVKFEAAKSEAERQCAKEAQSRPASWMLERCAAKAQSVVNGALDKPYSSGFCCKGTKGELVK